MVWVLRVYSPASGPDVGSLAGGPDWFGLDGVNATFNEDQHFGAGGEIPHQSYVIFKAMFSIITPTLKTAAFAGKMKSSATRLFTVLSVTIVYAPRPIGFGPAADGCWNWAPRILH